MYHSSQAEPVSAPRRVVYTCLFGFSEQFNDFDYEPGDGVDYVCFTDDPDLRSERWEIRLTGAELLDTARAAKRIKALPHRFLPDYDWSLYVDNTVRLKRSPRELFDRYLAPAESPLVCFKHPWRDCVYDEAEAVIELEFDDPARVRHQMEFYRRLGYPPNAGLAKGAFMLRRHHDPALVPVMERWHQQVLCHSKRDQLSLNPVAWFDGFEIGYLEEAFLDFGLAEWPVVKNGVRLPRDFDEARYRALNPDVNVPNCRKHYLLHGAAEQRAYK
ncbi:MAG: hypothetical protein JWM87_350 [Candidatus Eremiobacteraeota bacterium]|nr:hypothetical protein [Candidatus Eremiobacteraeota bacterium]